jgi:ceramide glucosyltransferase
LIYIFLALAAVPFIYYLIAIYSAWCFARRQLAIGAEAFTPPVSILKPIKGSDLDAYENFASFCRQDYPNYELLFCLDKHDIEVAALIDRLKCEFPERRISPLMGSGRDATNDKAAKLARLVN